MKQYDSYKDSGVEWIGKIPSHWEVCRLKNHSQIVLGKMIMSTPPKGEEDNYTLEKYLKSRNIGWLNVIDSENEVDEMWFNQYEKEIYRLHTNDIVMNEGGDIGKIGLWNNTDYPCYIQNSVNKITTDNATSPFYLQYLLFAIAKTNYFWSIVNPISIAHLTKEKLSSTPIVLPSLSEQEVIASYLDKKCGEIDKAVATQEKRVELLKELRQNIITQAVTRGINPDAPLKDSGVEWIKEIPSHWKSVPIKYSVESPYNSFIDGDWIESNVIVSDGIRYLTTGNVGALKYKEQGSGFISESTFKELNCSEVFPGDILISRLNEPIGRACIVPDLGYRIVVAVDNVIYRPDTNLYDKQFLVYQMNCKPYADTANFIARGSTMSRVSRTTLGNFKLVIPPLDEQKKIVVYLNKKCDEIERSIEKAEHQIELLQELKQSIITEVVTGKRKVV